jgi:porin
MRHEIFFEFMTKYGIAILATVLGMAPSFARAQSSNPSPVPQRGPVEPNAGYFFAGTTGTGAARQAAPAIAPEETATEIWWNGKGILQGEGNPFFDARKSLEERGLKFTGTYQGAFFGVLASQGGSRGFWNEQISFGSELNFGKLLDIEALEGTTAFGNFRYRDSWPQSNPNEFVQANSMFSPTNWLSGTQFRVMSFGLEIGTENLLPVEDMVLLRAGWLQPQREFIDQPLSKLFLNTAVNSNKGVGGNIPFSSSFSTWGATLKINLRDTVYWKNGLFMSYPSATSSTNHGLAYQGFAPDTSLNGLFYMGELGFTPKIGKSELEGKYAFGGYYYGTPQNQTATWSGNSVDGRYGFYFQADQMLYREPSKSEKTSAPSDGKSFKEVAPAEKPKLSKQGLSTFNLITMAPGFATANNYPFYFQSGLVYTGLVPGRDKDMAMISIGYGAYQGGVSEPPRSYTAVIEGGYRFQINGWSYVQPFFQYFSRPDGTSEVANAALLGFLTGLVF